MDKDNIEKLKILHTEWILYEITWRYYHFIKVVLASKIEIPSVLTFVFSIFFFFAKYRTWGSWVFLSLIIAPIFISIMQRIFAWGWYKIHLERRMILLKANKTSEEELDSIKQICDLTTDIIREYLLKWPLSHFRLRMMEELLLNGVREKGKELERQIIRTFTELGVENIESYNEDRMRKIVYTDDKNELEKVVNELDFAITRAESIKSPTASNKENMQQNIESEDKPHSPAHVALLESARKAGERNTSKSTDIQEIEKVLQILLYAIEKHRLTFLYFAGAERINPSIPPNGRKDALNKDDLRHNEIPVKDIDNNGDFLFKYRHIMDGFAQKAVSQFGTAGTKPKTMTRDGKFIDIEGGSYPFWRLDEIACEYLEKTGDAILEACKQLLEIDTTEVCHALSEQAMNVIHDNDQPRWYSSVLVKWEYLLRSDEAIASLKKGQQEIITKKSINELSKITDKKDKESSNVDDDRQNSLPQWATASEIAIYLGLDKTDKPLRTALSRVYGKSHAKKNLRENITNPRKGEDKYRWNTPAEDISDVIIRFQKKTE